ncbi:hypothetical protein WJX77_011854 [Trebouxia sp. C0004]
MIRSLKASWAGAAVWSHTVQQAWCTLVRSEPNTWRHARSPHLQTYSKAPKQLGSKFCHFTSRRRASQRANKAAEAEGYDLSNVAATDSSNPTRHPSQDQIGLAAVPGSAQTDADLFVAMKTKLNFKYPRARKLLLLFWGMANLAPSTKASIPADELFETYCQSTTASQRVPQADFVSELIKAMALVNMVPKQVPAGQQQFLRGVAWSQDTQQGTAATTNDGAGSERPRAALESSPANRATKVVEQPIVESSPKTTKHSKLRKHG